VKATPPKMLSDVFISKAYGCEGMWDVKNDNTHVTKL